MFKLYSKGCEYAIRALTEAGVAEGVERFQASEVCRRAGLPEPFTRKVFQALAQAGFLKAARGPGGGYVLTRSPRKISLVDFIKAVDGEETFGHCVMGLPQCGSRRPCPLHNVWAEAKEQLLAQLRDTSLQDVIETAAEQRLNHSPSRRARGAKVVKGLRRVQSGVRRVKE
ncbi:MAG: Rrf2 family transcriptional regulator [Candidatus Hydrogenedentes bacterium]|nr:Rrf2 family transcriptional regulator [Candidatus Hydrogenedentota bacterium]